ncbi:MAG: hypothetical protein QOK26_2667, partial [Pseudonocardiales bacterium]|nr:hypothetical protein [Pseudonocardiales bacterium]
PIVTGALAYATSSFVVPLVVAAGVALVGGLAWLFGIRARPAALTPAEEVAAGSGASSAEPSDRTDHRGRAQPGGLSSPAGPGSDGSVRQERVTASWWTRSPVSVRARTSR